MSFALFIFSSNPVYAAPWWWAQFTAGDGVNSSNSGFERWNSFALKQAVDASDTAYVCSFSWGSADIGAINGINAASTAGLNGVSAAGGMPTYLIADGDGGANLTNAQTLSDGNVTDITEPAGGSIMHLKDAFAQNRGYLISSANHTAGGYNSQNNNALYFPAAKHPLLMRKVENQMYEMARGTYHDATTYGTINFYSPYGDTVELRYSPDDNNGGSTTGSANIMGRIAQLVNQARQSIFYMIDGYSSSIATTNLATEIINNNGVTIVGCGGAGTDWDATIQGNFEANHTHRNEGGAFNRLHSKVMIVDMEIVATGSPNFTSSAMTSVGGNDEAHVIVHDFRLARKYMQHFHKILATATADPSADAYDNTAPAGATALIVTASDTAFYAAWTPPATTDVSRYYLFIDTAAMTQAKAGDRTDNDADGYIDEDPRGDYDGFISGTTFAAAVANDDDADGATDEDLWMAPEVMVKGRASASGGIATWNVGDTLLPVTNYYFGIISVDTQGNEGAIATFGPVQLGIIVDTKLAVFVNTPVSDTNGRRGDTNVVAAQFFILGDTGNSQDTLTIFAVKNLGNSDSRDMTVRLWRDEDSNAKLTSVDTMLAQLVYSNTTRRFQATFASSDSRVRLSTSGKTFIVSLDVFDTAGLGETFQARIEVRTCSSPRRDSGPGSIATNAGRITFIFVDTTPPAAFSLASPPNLHETRATNVTLRWNNAIEDSSPPVKYQVQIDTAGTFVSNLLDTSGVTETFIVATLRANDTSFWRVIATDNEGNARVCSSTFRIVVDTMPPGPATLIAPANATDTTRTSITFLWNAAVDTGSGINGYRLQVDTANTFVTLFVDSFTTLTSGARTLPANDSYYWRVVAVDDAGNTRVVAANLLRIDTMGPAVGSLSTPASNLDTQSRNIVFRWTAATDSISVVTGYRLQIDTTAAFTNPFIDSATTLLTGTRTLAVNDTYYWRVVAIDNLLNTSVYAFTRLRIDTTTPPPARLIRKNGDSFTSAVSLTWVASTDSVSGLSFYIVQVDTAGTFISLKDSATHWAGDTAHLFSLPKSDTYFWRVLSFDSAGNFSTSSPGFDTFVTYITDTTPPAAFALTAPGDLAETNLTTITLRWQNALDSSPPVRYRVQIDTAGTFASLYFDSTGLLETYINAPFRVNETSTWRVIATDNSGNTVAATSTRRIVVDTAGPAAGSLIAPANSHDTRNTAIMFRWNAASDTGTGVSGYRLQIDTAISFAVPLVDSFTPLTAATPVSPLRPNDTYYWRIIAVDDVGNTTAVAPNLLRIDTVPPQAGALTVPSTPHDTTATTFAFAWTAANDTLSGNVTYRLQIATTSTFASPLVDSATPLTSATLGSSLPANDTYYWRVIAIDNAGNTVAYPSSLFRIDTTGPPASSSTLPADLLDTTATTIAFSWTTVIDTGVGNVSYRLQVDLTGLFVANILDTVVASSPVIVTLPANDQYFWRVITVDSLANSTPNPARSFRIDTAPPTQVMLTTQAGNILSPPVYLDWSLSTDSITAVAYYIVEIDTSGAFASLSESAITIHPDIDYFSSLVTTDTYFWRVKAVDTVGNVSISASDFFRLIRTDTLPPSVFTLTQPANNAITTLTTIAFQWSDSRDDTSPPVRYNLQVATSPAFTSNNIDTSWLLDTFFTATLPANDTYYVRVIARDNALNTTVASTILFAIDTAPPSAPILSVYSGAIVPAPLQLVWSPSSDAISGTAYYNIQIDTDPSFALPLVDSIALSHPDTDYWTLTLPSDTYYWRVFAFDSSGNVLVSVPAVDSFRLQSVDTTAPIIISVTASPIIVSNSGTTTVVMTVLTADSIYVDTVLIHLSPIGRSDSTAFTPGAAVPSTDSRWTLVVNFDTLVAGDTYDLVVIARDASGNSSTTTLRVIVVDTSSSLARIVDTPLKDLRVGGNELSIVSTYGDSFRRVVYEYRSIVPPSGWMICTAARGLTNPDTQAPFWGFFWDISLLTSGAQYDVRALGVNQNGETDPSPSFIRITVDQVDSIVHEYRDATTNNHVRRQRITPETAAQLLIADGTGLLVPKGSVADSTWLRVTEYDSAPSSVILSGGVTTAGSGSFREFIREDGLRSFKKTLTITLPYSDTDALNDKVGNLSHNEADLAIYRYDEFLKVWVKEPTSQVDAVRNVVTATVNHFTIFAVLIGSPAEAGLGNVVVYPNPYIPYDNIDKNGRPFSAADPTSGIIFDSLPVQVSVEIFNAAGRVVATFSKTANEARSQWDARSDDGGELASGVYVAVIKSPSGARVIRKIMIVR